MGARMRWRKRRLCRASCIITRECTPVGPVATSSVAPKIATVGMPKAEAMCIAPESFVRKTSHWLARITSSLKNMVTWIAAILKQGIIRWLTTRMRS